MENANARVCVTEGSNVVELAQASAGLPCGQPEEYDLFISPNCMSLSSSFVLFIFLILITFTSTLLI